MSKPLEQTELNRLAWLTALRTQGHRQCHGVWSVRDVERRQTRVCAMELVREMFPTTHYQTISTLGRKVGLDFNQIEAVLNMNDGYGHTKRYTFAEIADVVGSWFPDK